MKFLSGYHVDFKMKKFLCFSKNEVDSWLSSQASIENPKS